MTNKKILIKQDDPIRSIKYLFNRYYDTEYFNNYYRKNKDKIETEEYKKNKKEYLKKYYILNKKKIFLLSDEEKQKKENI